MKGKSSQMANALEDVKKEKKMSGRVAGLFIGLIVFICIVGGIAYMAGLF